MKILSRLEHIARTDCTTVTARKQVGVALAKGVAHLGQHRAQGTRLVMAEPETHRIEHIAEHPRKGLQHDFAIQMT